MPGRITIDRIDSISDLAAGWSVQLDAMPHSPLGSTGSTGQVSFSAPTTSQCLRTMYNGALFEYYYPSYLDEVPIPSTTPLPPPVTNPPVTSGWGANGWGDGIWGGTVDSGGSGWGTEAWGTDGWGA